MLSSLLVILRLLIKYTLHFIIMQYGRNRSYGTQVRDEKCMVATLERQKKPGSASTNAEAHQAHPPTPHVVAHLFLSFITDL